MAKNQGNGQGASERRNRPICAQAVGPAVHQIWVQGDPPGEALELMDKVEAVCMAEGRPYYRWCESMRRALWTFESRNTVLDSPLYAEAAHHCPNYSVRADLMRFIVLHEVGGLYLDADVDLRVLPPADLAGAWVMGMDRPPNVPRLPNCAVMAGPAGHPYFRRLLDLVECAPEVLNHPYAGMGMAYRALAGCDVRLWPFDAWNDVYHPQWGWCLARFGTHLYRAVKWRSQQRIG